LSSKTRKDLEYCYRFKRGLGIRIFFLNLLSCNEYKYNLGSVTRNSIEQGIVWNKKQYETRNIMEQGTVWSKKRFETRNSME